MRSDESITYTHYGRHAVWVQVLEIVRVGQHLGLPFAHEIGVGDGGSLP